MTVDQPSCDPCVTVKLFAWLRDTFGLKEIRIPVDDAPDVGRLFEELQGWASDGRSLLGESGRLEEGFIVLLNGRSIDFAGGMTARLAGGDEVAVFPPIAGG